MPHPLPICALVETAQKRRLLTKVTAERLGEYAASKGVSTVGELEAWLKTGEGLSPELATKLRSFLPMPGVKPFGQYHPLAHLADGGMGSVWLAMKPGCDDLLVIKTIKSDVPVDLASSQGNEFIKRFERESEITRRLDHPNVVKAIDAGVSSGNEMYMVLEYVDSGDLRDLVEKRGGLSEALALAIMHQVTDGLCEAHRMKLVHRDIKPPNIFVASDGRAKLADFGIARSTEANRPALTMQGAIVGSPMYMSPEQVMTDTSLDIRSDVYAMGAVLYFCLACEPPYTGKLQEILHQHCTAPVPDARRKRPQIGDRTQAIINRAMAKDRTQRYADPAELRDALLARLGELGAVPGALIDESTAKGDLSGATPFRPGTRHDLRTITADLALRDLPTVATGAADQATITSANPGHDQATIAANLNADQATITVDLNPAQTPASSGFTAEMPTVAANLNEMQTMTAMLLSQEPEPEVPARPPGHDPGTSATVASAGGTILRILSGAEPAIVQVSEATLDGDFSKALAVDWVSLLPAVPVTDGPGVILVARPKLVLGKLREPPVDLCVRNYPLSIHKDNCQRVSRQHCAIRLDAIANHLLVEDLNAPNGTMLDGLAIPAGKSAPLALGAENILVLSGVVSLWLRVVPRRGSKVTSLKGAVGSPASCGLDSDAGFDALAISRPENRPELAYAQVLRRISVGGPGADLPLAGARTRSAVELALFAGRWIWRTVPLTPTPDLPWKPLIEGTELDCGGRMLRATAGSHMHF
jgi:serine/threonine protein kinase